MDVAKVCEDLELKLAEICRSFPQSQGVHINDEEEDYKTVS